MTIGVGWARDLRIHYAVAGSTACGAAAAEAGPSFGGDTESPAAVTCAACLAGPILAAVICSTPTLREVTAARTISETGFRNDVDLPRIAS